MSVNQIIAKSEHFWNFRYLFGVPPVKVLPKNYPQNKALKKWVDTCFRDFWYNHVFTFKYSKTNNFKIWPPTTKVRLWEFSKKNHPRFFSQNFLHEIPSDPCFGDFWFEPVFMRYKANRALCDDRHNVTSGS